MSLSAGELRPHHLLSTAAIGIRLATVMCALLFACQLWLIWSHIPWLDELQAALLARDTHGLAQWWSNFRYEGHAPLWHLLLKAAQLVVDVPTSLRLVQTLCAATIFALIVRACPLSWPWRVALCSNYFLFFEFGVIARDYSLGVALSLATTAFRRHRVSWLLIALVPQAGTQFLLIAALLVAQQWRDGRRSPGGIAGVVVGMAIAYLWMRPAADFQALGSLIATSGIEESLLVSLRYAGTALVPVDLGGHLLGWVELGGNAQFLLLATAGVLILPIAMLAGRGFGPFAWGIPLFALATGVLSIFVYSLFTRHFGLIPVLVVLAAWRHPEALRANVFARAWLILLSAGGLLSLMHGSWQPFSSAESAAKRLARGDLAGLPIIPVDTMLGVEASAYLGVRTVNVTNQCWQTFVRWKGPVFLPPFDPIGNGRASEAQRAADAMRRLEATTARLGGEAVLLLDPKADRLLSLVPTSHVVPVDEVRVGEKASLHRIIRRMSVPAMKDAAPLPACAN